MRKLFHLRTAAFLLAALCGAAMLSPGLAEASRNTVVLGCWGAAEKGDSVDLKLHFVSDGALVQYDENQVERRKRSFGAWEMEEGSSFLTIYWPNGLITRYHVKRIGPILHFSGVNGVRSFTLREVASHNCWEPRI